MRPFKKGSIISCPTCELPLLELIKNVKFGTKSDESMFKSLNENVVAKNGHELACPDHGIVSEVDVITQLLKQSVSEEK